MTLEQAINHLEEELKNKQDWSCVACKEDHEQLLSWLKELQAIKNINPNEAIKLFEEFKNILLDNVVFLDTDLQRLNTIKQYILKAQEMEKELKVLKVKYADILINNEFIKYTDNNENILNIIKQKNVDIKFFKLCKTVKDYNKYYNEFEGEKQLNQEEFDTLKEWMK